jgi:2-phospho-L-lactate/phosphoenolpyruvate guanylyltransferase
VRLPRRVDYPEAPVKVLAIPVKSLSEAKSRLSPALTPLERGALTLAMLEDVLDAAEALPGWDTWVISPDEAVLEVAVRRGARTIVEEKPPLANAVRQVETEAHDAGAEALAVLLADTALVTHDALTRAVHALGPIVLAPDEEELGTNLLLRRPPRAISARFGSESFRKHLETAAVADLPATVVQIPELAFDLDVPGDILTLLRARRRGRTREVCLAMDLGARIRVRT